ncbi:MAG: CRISPR-associated endonuclease Cas2 [Candidatus Staskawiczbacteria bacterium RIFOXYB1_FULL_37_44]|uniref:CRISPR-associated endonuclease Cas2 n=1 Tax=Candidatus Staskawiczbacteria bacterium RIFOXYB1_FULL_37_44 TaxID=1802223 RepID=A0A1G2IUL0_9BACT|nr:MAG: CRISPR-associated endonuclease Cas2 [Candidatus Staskawiczbacteria bacterium RIFOXYB1_FULL_37_44]OGZ83263.1 MAG: CRISPR-associated endonuclease Cas2 [Candidatus Staskawiczbacteria bacterium RIFOXYC1_FULL_37_52]OGZ87769.1 MAG: CRISPR-associated endonuclease Cas2 [Candidatus Staskawiczbacteria bacterium RIFOXYC2_FULL_37_19]OGZ89321.1 MAG: CRISPR-associated endonuclease Cas2 [Candidatus Staskawiczbacteria bacterium RIFOXYD1_FULL_37_110]
MKEMKDMKIRYGEITKDVLLVFATAGVFTIAATSPYFLINLTRAIIRDGGYNKKYRNLKEKVLARSLTGLNKNKIIIFKESEGKFSVKLTEKGKKVAREILFDNMEVEKQKIWDKKWRIIIFDIPERKGRQARNAMRWKLQKMGFFQLQKSVWVFPYPCEKEVQLISEVFKINPFVNIVTAEKIYNDNNLMEHFRLSV